MSSTRDSVTGHRDENSYISALRNQLRESQDMVHDLQKLSVLNREAMNLYASSSSNAKDKLVQNLRTENGLLFKSFSKAIEGQLKAESGVVFP